MVDTFFIDGDLLDDVIVVQEHFLSFFLFSSSSSIAISFVLVVLDAHGAPNRP